MAIERSNEISHSLNPHQKAYDENYYKALLPYISGNVADIGCGEGMFTKRYAEKPEVVEVIAIDKFASDFAHPKVTKVTAVIPDELTYFITPLDCVVSTEFIEHIPEEDLMKLLPKIAASLSPTGIFIGSTPNKIVPTTNPFHLREYTLDELRVILEKFFSEVTIWDCGHNCTVWIAKK